jgi:hypothetical protein
VVAACLQAVNDLPKLRRPYGTRRLAPCVVQAVNDLPKLRRPYGTRSVVTSAVQAVNDLAKLSRPVGTEKIVRRSAIFPKTKARQASQPASLCFGSQTYF